MKRSDVNPEHGDAIHRFVILLLYQAKQDQATELIIGIPSPDGVPIRFKIAGTWREMPPFPSGIRTDVLSELGRMAGFPAGQISGNGVLDLNLGPIRLRWMVAMKSADGECMLKRI